jgi:hypothetical protein
MVGDFVAVLAEKAQMVGALPLHRSKGRHDGQVVHLPAGGAHVKRATPHLVDGAHASTRSSTCAALRGHPTAAARHLHVRLDLIEPNARHYNQHCDT